MIPVKVRVAETLAGGSSLNPTTESGKQRRRIRARSMESSKLAKSSLLKTHLVSDVKVMRGSLDSSSLENISSSCFGPQSGKSLLTVGSAAELAAVQAARECMRKYPGPSLSATGGGNAFIKRATSSSTPNLISQHICIGAKEDAANLSRLKELGVTHILNAAQQVPNFHPRELVYLKLDLIDAPDQKLAPWQDKALHFLKHVEAVGGRVLVHCIAGVSRSVSIVVLHLMANHGICLKQALKHIRRYRAYIQPNEGFRYELAVAEVNILKMSSVSRNPPPEFNFYAWNAVREKMPAFPENSQAIGSNVCCMS